ncbi:hypothetical protein NDU88_000822 [Pleurodeles waltl]|uniref:Uncharacterized protein n=1 Tax=Pleurodeles waltl TaxID=8319 RepID=A0AAV7MN50_PLEWA|nr:hypothetical protein NDU88_000822 [Pleurodeles waltl]
MREATKNTDAEEVRQKRKATKNMDASNVEQKKVADRNANLDLAAGRMEKRETPMCTRNTGKAKPIPLSRRRQQSGEHHQRSCHKLPQLSRAVASLMSDRSVDTRVTDCSLKCYSLLAYILKVVEEQLIGLDSDFTPAVNENLRR